VRRRSKPFIRRESRGGTFRYLAACVAVLVVFTQFSSFAHMLLVRHATCPEHGELIHPDEDGAAPAHHDAVASHDKSQGPSIESGPESANGHGHDHCAVLAHRRDSTTLAAASNCPLPVPPPALAGIDGHRQILTPASFALYLLAPKNSPPV
jgi:hypothetical protein